MFKSIKSNHIIVYIFSFVIPVIFVAISYFQIGVYPGGPNTVLIYDMRGELLPMYGYLSHLGPGYDNLFHWMSGGLGGTFVGSAAMYLSFFDVLFSFIPISYLPTAIYALLLFKIGLCGLSFSIFISHSMKDKLSSMNVLFFSCCYALMSYVLVFSILLIWLDGIMLLPLLALLSERIVENKKSILFILLLTLCMIDDYYIAYMISISLALYYAFVLIEKGFDKKAFFNRFLLLIMHGLLSAGLSSFILFPVAFDLRKGKLSENIGISDGLLFKNNVFSVLHMLLPSNYANLGSNQPPYIFCGSIVLILVIVWLIADGKNIKARITSGVIVLIFFLSFIIGPLDRVWHGFRDPIGFSCRYSFAFSFFVICFAARGLAFVKGLKLKISNSLKKLILFIAFAYTLIELNMNSSFLLSKLMEDYIFANRDEYERICDVMETALESVNMYSSTEYGRLVKNFNYSCNDGALFGYDGLEMFTSSYNGSLISFMNSLGLNASNNYIKEPGLTPPLADVMNVRYYMSYWFDVSDYYTPVLYYKSHGIYQNENAFPFAYCISDQSSDENHSFDSDPFNNLNAVFSDIFGTDQYTDVFVECDYTYFDGDDNNYTYIVFTPDYDGHYWIYPEVTEDYYSNAYVDYLPSDLSYLTYSVDGLALGRCGFNDYRYCGDLGFMESGCEYVISFDAPSSVVGKIHLAYYDDELCTSLASCIEGLEVSRIGSDGISLSGNITSESDVLITLPYDHSYRVYVNQKKVEQKCYRNALMVLHLSEGNNDIVIKYMPEGLIPGLFISAFFTLLLIFLKRKRVL